MYFFGALYKNSDVVSSVTYVHVGHTRVMFMTFTCVFVRVCVCLCVCVWFFLFLRVCVLECLPSCVSVFFLCVV